MTRENASEIKEDNRLLGIILSKEQQNAARAVLSNQVATDNTEGRFRLYVSHTLDLSENQK